MGLQETSTVLCIVTICYLIGVISKSISIIKDNYIPCIVGICGSILGVIGMYTVPNFPANDILNAMAVGIVSGLSSTGVNQIYKQVKSNVGNK